MSELPPILDELPWTLEEREGRVCGVVTTDCRVRNDHGWLETWRAGEYMGHYADSFDATVEDEAIRNGDVHAAARVARTVERDPIVIAADAAVRSEPAFQAGKRFLKNPGGRRRNVAYATIHEVVSRHIRDGKTLTAALYDANKELGFSNADTPEALDKTWRRVLPHVTP